MNCLNKRTVIILLSDLGFPTAIDHAFNAAIAHVNQAVSRPRRLAVMRREQNSKIEFSIKFSEQA
jgi:hypothetical protein